jgi:hypothetical protein
MSFGADNKAVQLESQISKLQLELTTANETLTDAENAFEAEKKSHENTKKSIAGLRSELEAAQRKTAEKEATINAIESQIALTRDNTNDLKTEITILQKSLDESKSYVDSLSADVSHVTAEKDSALLDNKGIYDLLEEEKTAHAKTRDELSRANITGFFNNDAAADLKNERAKNEALRNQIAQLKKDIEAAPSAFNPMPGAYRIAEAKKLEDHYTTLEDDLVGTEDETAKRPDPEEDPDEYDDEYGYLGDSHSTCSSHCGSDIVVQAPEGLDVITIEVPGPEKIVEVRVDVPGPERVVYVPGPASAHHPIICWIQVEFNLLVVLSFWLFNSFRLSNRSKAGINAQISGSSKASSPANPNVQPSSSTGLSAGPVTLPRDREPYVPPGTEVPLSYSEIFPISAGNHPDVPVTFGPEPYVPPGTEIPILFPRLHGQRTETVRFPRQGVESLLIGEHISGPAADSKPVTDVSASPKSNDNRPWYAKILSPDPEDLPAVVPTLWGALVHLLVYAFMFMGMYMTYSAHYERERWLTINDTTRIYLLRILEHPHEYGSGIAWLLAALPELWKHNVDVTLWRFFIDANDLQVNFPMPG